MESETIERIIIDYTPRQQFIDFHNRTQQLACIVAHRRAGKTVACVHDLQRGALTCQHIRPRFAYIAPQLKQAKTVAWAYLREAMAVLRPLGADTNESELRVDYPNGGQVRLYGADNPDALRGIYLDGVVLDEFADMDPRIGQVIFPALTDRGGWAVFIGTPKGRNEFYEKWIESQKNTHGDWYSLMLKASDTGLISQETLDGERTRLTPEEYLQEYECSFEAAIKGAYFGKLMVQAEEAGRICGVPYDPAARVWTAWDLGYRDATAVWFAQVIGKEIHIIDYYESVGTEIAEDVSKILAKPYKYAGHILPHDAYATSKQTGRTTAQIMEGLGLRDVTQAPDHKRHDGISNVQLVIPRCWFDKEKCAQGIDALKMYRAEYDETLKVLKSNPLHDWTSHAADAMRYLAMTLDNVRKSSFTRKIEYPALGTV